MLWTVVQTEDFKEWFKNLDKHTQRIVDARLERIQSENHFGTVNCFDGLTELKWKSGIRVYTVEVRPNLILLLGGNKNGQAKDIRKAKKLLAQIDPS